jgi:hypothetical protein
MVKLLRICAEPTVLICFCLFFQGLKSVATIPTEAIPLGGEMLTSPKYCRNTFFFFYIMEKQNLLHHY